MIDLMMPGMDGYKAIPAMHALRPDAKIIAMSGMIQADKFEPLAAKTQIEVLNKPFTGQKVLETLTHIL